MNRRTFLQLAGATIGSAVSIAVLGEASQPVAADTFVDTDVFDLDLFGLESPTAFVALDDMRAWAGFEDGTLYHTLDGGASWTQVMPASRNNGVVRTYIDSGAIR